MAWWWLALAWASLGYEEVMAAVDARVPELAAAEARREAASARVDVAVGAFDPSVSAAMSQYGGQYQRDVWDVSAEVETPWGPELSVGYLRGRGDFPAYDGMYETDDPGLLRLRAEVPLLDGLLDGEARTALLAARARELGATGALEDARLDVRWKAARAYWAWVAASQVATIEDEQLRVAKDRATALAREVEEGTRAPLDRLDNERVLYEREARVVEARRAQEVAALSLSLWLRDAAGRPRVPDPSLAPKDWGPVPALGHADEDLRRALDRPEVRVVDAALAEADAAVRRARNATLPTLDAYAQVDQGFAGGSGEWVVGAKAELQPLLRKERGTTRAVAARRGELEAVRQALQDRAHAEVAQVRARVEAHEAQVAWAAEGADRAREVLGLEARRVELGASDLFALLLREEALAKAQKGWVDAQLALRLALAERDRVVGTARD